MRFRRRILSVAGVLLTAFLAPFVSASRAAAGCSTATLCPAYPCEITGTHEIDSGCVLDFAGDVTIRGALKSPSEGGGFTVRTPGDLVLDTGVLRSLGADFGSSISIEAGGIFRMLGAFARVETSSLPGALDISITASEVDARAGRIAADGGASAECGESGGIAITASGPIFLGTIVSAEAGAQCGGGDIDIDGASIVLARPIDSSGGGYAGDISLTARSGDILLESAAALRSRGKYSEPEFASDGGGVYLVADAGSIILEGDVDNDGGNPDASGGDLDFLASAAIHLGGTVSSTGAGPFGFGGFLIVDAGTDLTVEGLIDLDGKGESSDGGYVELTAAGTLTASSVVRARGGSDGSGGDLEASGQGALQLAPGAVWRVDGGSSAGTMNIESGGTLVADGLLSAAPANAEALSGSVDITGCAVTLAGTIDVGHPIAEPGDITVRSGTLVATATADLQAPRCVGFCIDLSDRDGVVSLDPAARFDPEPLVSSHPSFTGCCGNATVEAWEGCDDGNPEFCDGCQPDCTVEPSCADDGNECTRDCRADLGCVYTAIHNQPCADDGDLCTADLCQVGTCTHLPMDCDDGIACTTEFCDAELGCVATPQDALCDDGNPCTDEVCDAVLGCVATPVADGAACDDASVCTTEDACIGGACVGTGPPLACDDSDPCTVDSCQDNLGCTNLEDAEACPCVVDGEFLPADAACADGTSCTRGDVCDGAGGCVAGAFCEDGDPCTVATACYFGECVYADTGCTADCAGMPDGTQCSDGALCTEGVCVAGSCESLPRVCDDGDACNGTEACFEGVTACRQMSHAPPICAANQDSWLCYRARTSKGAAAVTSPGTLAVVDGAGSGAVDLRKRNRICLRTRVGSGAAPMGLDGRVGWQTKPARGTKFARVGGVVVDTSLGTVAVDLKKPASLLLAAGLGGEPGGAASTDDLQCYVASLSKGTPKPALPAGVAVEDALGSLVLDVKRIKALCLPADLDGADPAAPSRRAGLLCAKVRKTLGTAPFLRSADVALGGPFAAAPVDVLRPDLLCAPAQISLPGDPG